MSNQTKDILFGIGIALVVITIVAITIKLNISIGSKIYCNCK